jgi:hypothetical protein
MSSPSKHFFEIQSTSIPLEEVAEQIEKKIQDQENLGTYLHHDLKQIMPLDLLEVEDESQFLEFYMKTLQRAWAIDINDFPIPRKPGLTGLVEFALKKVIWNALKFYTYRLFSQQREFNAQMSYTLTTMHKDYNSKINAIQKQILALKNKANVS